MKTTKTKIKNTIESDFSKEIEKCILKAKEQKKALKKILKIAHSVIIKTKNKQI